MHPISHTHRELGKILAPHGYEALPKQPFMGFGRSATDGISARVTIEKPSDVNQICIQLACFDSKSANPNHPNRSIWLEDFHRDSTRYGYRDAATLRDAIVRVKGDMVDYGIAWLDGVDVVTPAIQASRESSASHQMEEAVRMGRDAFKANDYKQALLHFERAAGLGSLSELDHKYRVLLLTKSSTNHRP
jgi:hypothetical protein